MFCEGAAAHCQWDTVGTCGVFSAPQVRRAPSLEIPHLSCCSWPQLQALVQKAFWKGQIIISSSWVNPEPCFSSPGPAVSVISVILGTCHGSTGDLKLKLPTSLTALSRLLVVVGATTLWAGCR